MDHARCWAAPTAARGPHPIRQPPSPSPPAPTLPADKTRLEAQFEQQKGDQDVRKRLESSKRTDRRRRSKWREQKEAGAAAARVDGDSVVPSISSTSSAPPPRQSARARTAVNKACKCMCKGLRCRRGQHCPCLDPTKAAEPDSLAEFCADCLVDRCRCDGGCVGTGLSAVRCPCADGSPAVVASGQKRCEACETAKKVAQAGADKACKTAYDRETFVCGPKFGENGGCGQTWSKCNCFNDLPGMEDWKDGIMTRRSASISWEPQPPFGVPCELHGRYDRACDHALAWYSDKQVRGARCVMSDARCVMSEQSPRLAPPPRGWRVLVVLSFDLGHPSAN